MRVVIALTAAAGIAGGCGDSSTGPTGCHGHDHRSRFHEHLNLTNDTFKGTIRAE
jgi:hypothetical protein